jgi:hypothetical protein
MHPHSLFISVHRKLSFSCQRRVKDCFRHPARSTDNCWVVSTKVQNALPLSQCCHGSRGDQLRREMAGSVTVYVERFQVHVARDLAGKPRMGMGRHHGVCGPLKFYLLFQSLDGGNQGFVATGDDTLQLGIALLDHSLQFSRLFLEVFSGLVVQ